MKKIISVILVMAMVCGLFALPVNAAEIKDGKTTLYNEKDNELTYVDEETGEVKEMTEIQEGNGNNE